MMLLRRVITLLAQVIELGQDTSFAGRRRSCRGERGDRRAAVGFGAALLGAPLAHGIEKPLSQISLP
jgi:hypothetical protein